MNFWDSVWAMARCLMRGHHDPVRHHLGGFVCLDCDFRGADLDEMGFKGEGYVLPLRRTYTRGNDPKGRDAGITRSQWGG